MSSCQTAGPHQSMATFRFYKESLGRHFPATSRSWEPQEPQVPAESGIVQPRSQGSSNCTAPSVPPWLGPWLRNTQPPGSSQYFSVSPGSLMELPMRQSVCALRRCVCVHFLPFTIQPFKVDKKLADVVGLQMLAGSPRDPPVVCWWTDNVHPHPTPTTCVQTP